MADLVDTEERTETRSFWPEVQEIAEAHLRENAEAIDQQLAVLQQKVCEIEETPPSTEIVSQVLYGFETQVEKPVDRRPAINSLKKEENALRETLQKGVSFFENSTALAVKLAQAGIETVATVPEKLFAEICKKSEVWRFESITKDGMVAVPYPNGDDFSAFLPESTNNMLGKMFLFSWLMGIVTLLSATYGFFFQWFPIKIGGAHLLPKIVMATIVFFLFFVLWSVVIWGKAGPMAKRMFFRWFRRASQASFLRTFFPEMRDSGDSRSFKTVSIPIRFPNAPQHFADRLRWLTNASFQPMIGAVADAVSIDMTEIARVMRIQIKQDEQQRRERERFAKCPILYYKENGVVAVISSFGEFPAEEEVLDWVRKEGLQFCFGSN